MIEKSSTLYKIIILYMVERVNFLLTNSQITNFFLDNDYTTYFHIQQTIHDLVDSNLLEEKKRGDNTYYQSTEDGRTTLSYFEKNVSDEIRLEVDKYLKDNSYQMRNDNATTAQYYRTPNQEFSVHLQVVEKKDVVINLELTVPTEEMAKTFCAHWPKKNQEIYSYILDMLSQ